MEKTMQIVMLCIGLGGMFYGSYQLGRSIEQHNPTDENTYVYAAKLLQVCVETNVKNPDRFATCGRASYNYMTDHK